MPRASIRPLRAGGLVALGLLVALAVTGCKRSDDPRLRLKSLNHTTITFQHGTLGHPWDLAYRSRHLSVLVGGLRPFVQLSDSVAELFDLPERLQSRYRSFRYAGQLGFAPYREPFRVGVERFLPVVVVGDRVLEPEFYSVLIQDRKIKLYGLLRQDKRIKVVHTYALHDDDFHVTMRTTVANLKTSTEPIALQPGARLELRSMHVTSGKPLRSSVSTVSFVGWAGDGLCVAWAGRGYRLRPRRLGDAGAVVLIERGFVLKPGEEITYDHSLHIDADCPRLRRAVDERGRRRGGLFIRQS